MKLFSAAALLTAIVSVANALTVNTPVNVVQCQPILITWDPAGSAGPFFLSVHPGATPTAPALYSWDNLTGTSFSWLVPVPAGTSLGLLLRDTTGASSQSAPFTVQPGSTTDCPASSSSVVSPSGSSSSLSGNSTVSSVTPTTTTTKTTTSSTIITTTTTKPPTSTPSSVRPSSTSSSTPTPTGGTSGGASGGVIRNAINISAAGFLAALVGVVLA